MLVNVPHVPEKNVYLQLLDMIFYMCQVKSVKKNSYLALF
jgi:hypothetical protein